MRVAILGATGAVGRTMLEILEERGVGISELVPLASARSAGTRLAGLGREWTVREPSAAAFEGCDLALFSAGATRSREWAPVAAAAGATVIDNSSAWRMEPAVPLVVPEVNARALERRELGIVANPNCATIQLVLPLAALERAADLEQVLVTTCQSVSGAGHRGVAALENELAGRPTESPFAGRIAGNVIPSIGPRGADGWNEEEVKVRAETRRILDLPDLPVSATCVRVPVHTGHSISAAVQLGHPLARAEVLDVLRRFDGVVVHEGATDPLPADVAGRDTVHVGHVRIDPDDPRVVHLWIVADNLRKGAATNAVQIAECLSGQPAGAVRS